MASTLSPPPLRWDGARLHVLDQTRLPARGGVLVLEGAEDTALAIERLAVRGAPLIGVAAAYGLAMEVAREPTLGALERGAERLATCRPDGAQPGLGGRARARRGARRRARCGWPARRAEAAEAIARRRGRERRAGRARRGAAGRRAAAGAADRADPLQLRLPGGVGPRHRARRDRRARRPASRPRARLRGAAAAPGRAADRVGAGRLGIEHALVVDSAAAGLIRTRRGRRGRDRLRPRGRERRRRQQGRHVRPGARRARRRDPVRRRRPVLVGRRRRSRTATRSRSRSAPATRSGPRGGALLTVPGTPVRNPAFDVTPAALVWALVTERGVARPVDAAAVAAVA